MKHYTDAKKVEVVTTYLALGKAPLVEAVTGVPKQTIRQWKMSQWWKDLEAEIRSDDDTELDGKLSKIINKTLDTVVDRIDHGDFILDSRSGTIKRVPVKMKDAHKVSTDLIDKRNLIRGKPTSITQKVTVDDMMIKLADEFKKWAKLVRPDERVIDGETISEELGAISDSNSPVENRVEQTHSDTIQFNTNSDDIKSDAGILKEIE